MTNPTLAKTAEERGYIIAAVTGYHANATGVGGWNVPYKMMLVPRPAPAPGGDRAATERRPSGDRAASEGTPNGGQRGNPQRGPAGVSEGTPSGGDDPDSETARARPAQSERRCVSLSHTHALSNARPRRSDWRDAPALRSLPCGSPSSPTHKHRRSARASPSYKPPPAWSMSSTSTNTKTRSTSLFNSTARCTMQDTRPQVRAPSCGYGCDRTGTAAPRPPRRPAALCRPRVRSRRKFHLSQVHAAC
jgi:hypothetical protein